MLIAARARAAADAGTPLEASKPPRDLPPFGWTVVAYPMRCGDRQIAPQNVVLSTPQGAPIPLIATDAVLRDPTNPQVDDRRPRNVPRHAANVWTRYNLVQASDETFGLGLGVVAVDDRLAAFGGQLRLPDYTRWDAAVFYRRQAWDFGLYFENLFDRQYYAGSVTDLQVAPGAPFTVRVQSGVTF